MASQFAYGKIGQIKRFLTALFGRIGLSPSSYLGKGDFSNLEGLYYRFQKEDEIIHLFQVLGRIYEEHGGVGEMLGRFYEGDARSAIWRMRSCLVAAKDQLRFFLPKESPANPMKRWNLYLRWMVRRDEIDLGLWDFMDARDLIVPLDANIFKIGHCLGWTKRKNPSWNAAVEITRALRNAAPADPLKYDFLLCHGVGIAAGCRGNKTEACREKCPVYDLEV